DRGGFLRSILARLDLWQRAPRSTLSRRLAAGWRPEAAASFSHRHQNGPRDPRYLDAWLLAGGMSLQLAFHIAIKTARLSPKSAARWRKIHIFVGYLLIAAFISHSDFSLPDTGFE